MCGIVGYIGHKQAAPILLNGLAKLEYRGYDSAGIAVFNLGNDNIQIAKAKGKLKNLAEKTEDGTNVIGTCGIGHTRWATHGEPTENNAHPHFSEDNAVTIVHNGIIENYQELKVKLEAKGYQFYSRTDTEVAAKLIDSLYKETGDCLQAIAKMMNIVRGSYALGVLFKDEPGVICAARKDSPLIIGKNDDECLIASDVPAILDVTRNVYYIGNHEMAKITNNEVVFYDINCNQIEKELVEIKWDAEAASKGGFDHFMMKEIYEQPKAVADTLTSYLNGDSIDLSKLYMTSDELASFERIYIVACGSAYHTGVAAKYVIEQIAGVPCEVDLASEFRYRKPCLVHNALTVVISQSGETADSLAALRLAKEKGLKTMAIVNVVGSSIARETDNVMYTVAGPEISVATTKAYSAQLICLYLLAIALGQAGRNIDSRRASALVASMKTIPSKITSILDGEASTGVIKALAEKHAKSNDIFFLGRGTDYAVSLEASLKLKEISYIHSEAYAAGELKHGTISLIEEETLVIGTLTQPELYEKTLSNMVEVKSRGAHLMGVTVSGNTDMVSHCCAECLTVPEIEPWFATSLAIVPLQVFAYYVSVAKGLDVDKPRNLAKSVTVE